MLGLSRLSLLLLVVLASTPVWAGEEPKFGVALHMGVGGGGLALCDPLLFGGCASAPTSGLLPIGLRVGTSRLYYEFDFTPISSAINAARGNPSVEVSHKLLATRGGKRAWFVGGLVATAGESRDLVNGSYLQFGAVGFTGGLRIALDPWRRQEVGFSVASQIVGARQSEFAGSFVGALHTAHLVYAVYLTPPPRWRSHKMRSQ